MTGRGDAGAATVATAIGSLILLAVTAAAAQIGSAVIARDRAELAADAAALAGAAVVLSGADAACAAASSIAAANHVALDSCVLDGADVLVTVGVSVGLATASARARAGPVAAQAPE